MKSLILSAFIGIIAAFGLAACTSDGSIDTASIQEAASTANEIVNTITESDNVAAITQALTTAGVIDAAQASEITAIAAVANAASDALASSTATTATASAETKAIKSASGSGDIKTLEAGAIKGVLAKADLSKWPMAKAALQAKGIHVK